MVSDRSATVRRGPGHIPHRSRPTQNSAVGRVSPRAPGHPNLLIRSMCRALMRDRPAVRRIVLCRLERLGRYECPRLMARGACSAEWADTGWRRDCGSPTRSREPWIGLSSASAASEAEPASEALAASETSEAISGLGPRAWKRRGLARGSLQIKSGGIQVVAGDGRGAGGCDGASRRAIPSNPSKIARGERTSSGTRRTLRPDRRYATGSDQRTRDETPQSAESSGPGRLERSRRTLTSALISWISALSSACSA